MSLADSYLLVLDAASRSARLARRRAGRRGGTSAWQVVLAAGDDAEPVFDNATREVSRRLAAAVSRPAASTGSARALPSSPPAPSPPLPNFCCGGSPTCRPNRATDA